MRLRALTLGELPWTDEFVRFCEDVEDAVAASDGDTVASLTETIGELRESLERETENAAEATRAWDQERDEHAETRQELARVADRCAELEAKLPQDVQELRAALVAAQADTARQLATTVRIEADLERSRARSRAIYESCRKAVNLLTPKRRMEFVASTEANAYADAIGSRL